MKCILRGSIYSEVPTFYAWDEKKQYPCYDSIEDREWEIEVNTLWDAEKIFAKTHPDYMMGGSISCENGDFCLYPVPNIEYGVGCYETQNARTKWATSLFE